MIRRPNGARRGNVVLETALVLPILLALAFGTVEFGYYLFLKHALQGVAREAARAAIVPGATNVQVNTIVADSMNELGLSDSGYTVTVSPSNISTAAVGTNISVTVQCTWGTVGVRPMQMIGANKLVKSVAVMRKEG